MKKSIVASIPINKSYKQAQEEIINYFPKVREQIKNSKNIFLKICIDHLNDFQYTNLELLQSILGNIRNLNSSANIYIMENNFYGIFTRLLANVSGITNLAKSYKAKIIYLDEKKAVPVTIGNPEDRYKIIFPQILVDQLKTDRKTNFYLNLARLKTHYQAKIAGGIFNQAGLINQQSVGFIHSRYFNQTIVDLLEYIKPDFTIVDANVVVAHGSLPPACLINNYAIPINRLVGGVDPVAVDRAALELVGYSPLEIEHVKLAIKQNLGEGDLDYIDIKGNLPSQSNKIAYSLEVSQLPQRMDIIFGNKKMDVENCLGLSLQFAQIIYKDFLGYNGFSLIVGCDFSKQQLQYLREPIIVLGNETCKDVAPYLNAQYQQVYYIDRCDNIRQIIAVLIKVMGISKYDLIGVNPFTIWKYFFMGKLNGLKYKLPSIDRKTKYWRAPKNVKKKKIALQSTKK